MEPALDTPWPQPASATPPTDATDRDIDIALAEAVEHANNNTEPRDRRIPTDANISEEAIPSGRAEEVSKKLTSEAVNHDTVEKDPIAVEEISDWFTRQRVKA